MSCFLILDLETTGLDPEVDQITEFAYDLIDQSGQTLRWDMGLRKGHGVVKHDRLPNEWVLTKSDYLARILPAQDKLSTRRLLQIIYAEINANCEVPPSQVHLVGANPAFDHAFLEKIRRFHGFSPIYSHRLIDVEARAAGRLGLATNPSLAQCAKLLGIPASDAPHTAQGDVALTKQIFLTLLKPGP
jgi:DNA polymerase III epsilon subunit-like protein